MATAKFGKPLWHLIDAKNQVVGRLATQIVHVLRGKHKPTFSPNYDCGDVVVVINAREVRFTGDKWNLKKYRWHTGYVGGLKEITAKDMHKKAPEEVLRTAVLGMLPKTRLRLRQAAKLRIFPGSNHLHLDKIPSGTAPVNV